MAESSPSTFDAVFVFKSSSMHCPSALLAVITAAYSYLDYLTLYEATYSVDISQCSWLIDQLLLISNSAIGYIASSHLLC